jgi:negative regulator of sigma E activity
MIVTVLVPERNKEVHGIMEADVSRNIEEQLSAFLDGELPEAELQMLIRRLAKDENYRATLGRYTLIGSILRDEPAFASVDEIRRGVMSRINSSGLDDALPAEQTVQKQRLPGASGFRRRMGSLLAASVAALAVFGMYQWEGDVALPLVANELPATQDVKRTQDIKRPPDNSALRAVTTRVPGGGRITADRMTSYMVSHGEFSRSLQGAMVDSRVFVQPASYQE